MFGITLVGTVGVGGTVAVVIVMAELCAEVPTLLILSTLK